MMKLLTYGIELVTLQADQILLDYCAGSGGKTLAIACNGLQLDGAAKSNKFYLYDTNWRSLERFVVSNCKDFMK